MRSNARGVPSSFGESNARGPNLALVPAHGPEGPRPHALAALNRGAVPWMRVGEDARVLQSKPETGTANASLECDADRTANEVVRRAGEPLAPAVLDDMNERFGADFSGVRVHYDGAATRAAEDLDALAFTVGQDIVFGSGEYAPTGLAGRRLLAHELAHTLQQRGPRSTGALAVSQPNDPLERQADKQVAAAFNGGPMPSPAAAAVHVARQAKGQTPVFVPAPAPRVTLARLPLPPPQEKAYQGAIPIGKQWGETIAAVRYFLDKVIRTPFAWDHATPAQKAANIAKINAELNALPALSGYADPYEAKAAQDGFLIGYGAGAAAFEAEALNVWGITEALMILGPDATLAGIDYAAGALRAARRLAQRLPIPLFGVGAGGMGGGFIPPRRPPAGAGVGETTAETVEKEAAVSAGKAEQPPSKREAAPKRETPKQNAPEAPLKRDSGQNMLGEAVGRLKKLPPSERAAAAARYFREIEANSIDDDPFMAGRLPGLNGASAWTGRQKAFVIDSAGNMFKGANSDVIFGLVNGELGIVDWSKLTPVR